LNAVRIASHRWYDLGSDVNWEDYGGMWGRPAPTDSEPDRWLVIRVDPEVDGGDTVYADAITVCVSQVLAYDLEFSGVPLDGLDEYGELIPTLELQGMHVRAYVETWGTQGVAGGDTLTERGNPTGARRARARAARLLL
jgi:hypothetical protein